MREFCLLLICLTAMGGCATRSTVPQNQMVWVRENVPCVLTGLPADTRQLVLAETIKGHPDGGGSASVATGPEAEKNTAEKVRATLVALNIPAMRIVLAPATGDHIGVTFEVRRLIQAQAEDSFFAPYWFTNKAVNPSFGRAMEANLGKQYVDKYQLDVYEKLGSPNPIAAVGAVDRYQSGKVRGLSDQSVKVGTSGQ